LPLEDEPSRHIARFLFPTERFRGEWRRHWVRPLVRYAVTLGLAVGAQFLIPRFVPAAHVHAARTGVAVAGGLIALHVLFAWEVGRLALTNRRVMLVEGVIRRRVSTAPLPRAGDLRLECSLAGRLFHYGDFVFERKSVFSRMRMVAALPRPNELYLRVVEEVYEPAAVEERFNFDRELEDF
jgi:PH (Pleckstrin Homology) domain-containing protein